MTLQCSGPRSVSKQVSKAIWSFGPTVLLLLRLETQAGLETIASQCLYLLDLKPKAPNTQAWGNWKLWQKDTSPPYEPTPRPESHHSTYPSATSFPLVAPVEEPSRGSTKSNCTPALRTPFVNSFDNTKQHLTLGSFIHPLQTIYLFTSSQIPDVLLPCTLFALFCALSPTMLSLPHVPFCHIVLRTPIVLLHLQTLILQFCLHNQRHPPSIAEDRINKPWRPLASARITPAQAHIILAWTYVAAIVQACMFGTAKVWVLYTMLVVAYNEWGGSDAHGIIRNALNAGGYYCFFASALKAALGSAAFSFASSLPSPGSSPAWAAGGLSRASQSWILILILALFTTFHSQDFRDREGDALRGRQTILTLMGERGARWSLVVCTVGWSILIPVLWFGVPLLEVRGGAHVLSTEILPSLVLAGTIAVLTLLPVFSARVKGKKLDGFMYRVWCLWMVSLCLMPRLAEMRAQVEKI